jgi:hypothetical protein
MQQQRIRTLTQARRQSPFPSQREMTMRKSYAGFIVAGIALTLSGTAAADVERSSWTTEGGSHIFKDDPLHSGVSVPGGANIKVRPRVHRVYLIRARTSFVPEMFKSVELM